MNSLRPCKFYTWDNRIRVETKGYFHQFIYAPDEVLAIVELEDGTVTTCSAPSLIFTDIGTRTGQYHGVMPEIIQKEVADLTKAALEKIPTIY